MSPNGQAPSLPAPPGSTAMVFGAGRIPARSWIDPHQHPEHQIAWAARGFIAVEIGSGHWVLPPTRALWIPGDTAHRTGSPEGADLRGIFVRPERCPVAFTAPTMIRVGRLLHELFEHLTADDTAPDQRERAEAVLFDLLEPVEVIPIGAPMPQDPRARAIAEALLRNPADDRTLGQWAATIPAGTRTVSRLFLTETGITFGQWRTQIRLAASLPLLATGMPVARIAERGGYATASAYVAAFRRAVGVSPGRYFAH